MSQTITREARLQEVIAAASENRIPFDDRRDHAPGDPKGEAREGIFTAADLTGEALAEAVKKTVRGKKLYVHPLSPYDAKMLYRWALHPLDEEEDGDPRDPARLQAKIAMQNVDMQTYQAILVCKQGPEPNALRCFSRADSRAIQKYLGYGTIKEICRISDDLSGDQETLQPGIARFFGCTLSVLQSCSGVLRTSTDCPPGLRENLTRLQSLIGRALTLGKLDSGILFELEELRA